ncbi:MAG: hypothetical protein H6Q88_3458 [Anaeromyxobacteraceae bacterium]|nr:hypothetical protein [Anaeromyxobacteraceae bacterium]
MVLPWEPAMAMPCFSRISSASISARGMTGILRRRASTTSGLSRRTAEEITTTSASPTWPAECPSSMRPPRPARRRVVSEDLRSDPETG